MGGADGPAVRLVDLTDPRALMARGPVVWRLGFCPPYTEFRGSRCEGCPARPGARSPLDRATDQVTLLRRLMIVVNIIAARAPSGQQGTIDDPSPDLHLRSDTRAVDHVANWPRGESGWPRPVVSIDRRHGGRGESPVPDQD